LGKKDKSPYVVLSTLSQKRPRWLIERCGGGAFYRWLIAIYPTFG
jgi:hypothetical protein